MQDGEEKEIGRCLGLRALGDGIGGNMIRRRKQFSITLPEEMVLQLDMLADVAGISRSRVIENILSKLLDVTEVYDNGKENRGEEA